MVNQHVSAHPAFGVADEERLTNRRAAEATERSACLCTGQAHRIDTQRVAVARQARFGPSTTHIEIPEPRSAAQRAPKVLI